MKEMNELDTMFKQLAARPSPEVPRNMEDSVWRQIRWQESLRESLLARVTSCIWRWQCVAAVVVAALMVGGGFAALRHVASGGRSVTQAVHLEVFSEYSPTLLLNRLYERL